MPFVSEAQRRYLWMHHPKIAQRWANKYGHGKNLPMHKKGAKSTKKKKKIKKLKFVQR